MILFEIGLINKFKISEKKIRILENEIQKTQNDNTFELQFMDICEKCKLTDRETQITKLMINGNDAKQISINLGISYNTVRNFKQKIYDKLNVQNTIELFNTFLN
jgi:DNA-binding CsgD family transcriptional regulator